MPGNVIVREDFGNKVNRIFQTGYKQWLVDFHCSPFRDNSVTVPDDMATAYLTHDDVNDGVRPFTFTDDQFKLRPSSVGMMEHYFQAVFVPATEYLKQAFNEADCSTTVFTNKTFSIPRITDANFTESNANLLWGVVESFRRGLHDEDYIFVKNTTLDADYEVATTWKDALEGFEASKTDGTIRPWNFFRTFARAMGRLARKYYPKNVSARNAQQAGELLLSETLLAMKYLTEWMYLPVAMALASQYTGIVIGKMEPRLINSLAQIDDIKSAYPEEWYELVRTKKLDQHTNAFVGSPFDYQQMGNTTILQILLKRKAPVKMPGWILGMARKIVGLAQTEWHGQDIFFGYLFSMLAPGTSSATITNEQYHCKQKFMIGNEIVAAYNWLEYYDSTYPLFKYYERAKELKHWSWEYIKPAFDGCWVDFTFDNFKGLIEPSTYFAIRKQLRFSDASGFGTTYSGFANVKIKNDLTKLATATSTLPLGYTETASNELDHQACQDWMLEFLAFHGSTFQQDDWLVFMNDLKEEEFMWSMFFGPWFNQDGAYDLFAQLHLVEAINTMTEEYMGLITETAQKRWGHNVNVLGATTGYETLWLEYGSFFVGTQGPQVFNLTSNLTRLAPIKHLNWIGFKNVLDRNAVTEYYRWTMLGNTSGSDGATTASQSDSAPPPPEGTKPPEEGQDDE